MTGTLLKMRLGDLPIADTTLYNRRRSKSNYGFINRRFDQGSYSGIAPEFSSTRMRIRPADFPFTFESMAIVFQPDV